MDDHPMNISIEPDKGAVEAWEKASQGVVKPEAFKRALALAVNRTLAQTRAEAIRQAMAQYAVKRKSLLDAIRTRPASASAPSAELTFTGPRIPLMQFIVKPSGPISFKGKPRQGRPQLYVQVRKDGGGPAKGLFVANMGKEPAVYKRKTPKRFPVSAEKGPSIVSMVGNETARQAIQEKAREALEKRIDHEMNRLMQK